MRIPGDESFEVGIFFHQAETSIRAIQPKARVTPLTWDRLAPGRPCVRLSRCRQKFLDPGSDLLHQLCCFLIIGLLAYRLHYSILTSGVTGAYEDILKRHFRVDIRLSS